MLTSSTANPSGMTASFPPLMSSADLKVTIESSGASSPSCTRSTSLCCSRSWHPIRRRRLTTLSFTEMLSLLLIRHLSWITLESLRTLEPSSLNACLICSVYSPGACVASFKCTTSDPSSRSHSLWRSFFSTIINRASWKILKVGYQWSVTIQSHAKIWCGHWIQTIIAKLVEMKLLLSSLLCLTSSTSRWINSTSTPWRSKHSYIILFALSLTDPLRWRYTISWQGSEGVYGVWRYGSRVQS